MQLRNIIGKPVVGEDFFGRERELADLQASSEAEHVLLLAPRRVGKTSLLHALAQRVDAEGTAIGVYVSVAPATTEAMFVRSLLSGIYATRRGRKLKRGLFARAFGLSRGVKSVRIAGSGVDLEPRTPSWQDDADRALAAVMTSGLPLLLLIDELPVLVLALARADPTGARVRAFLQWFRNLRQDPSGASKLRFVLAGSIGLDNITRRYQLTDTINDLRLWSLGPFEPAAAHEFLRRLAAAYQLALGPDHCAAICAAAGWLIPYHLQVIFSTLREHAHAGPPTTAMIDAAIETVLDRRPYFSYWNERLAESLGTPGDAVARVVLARCAHDPGGVTTLTLTHAAADVVADPVERERTFSWVIDVLSNDGYLVEHHGRWRFRSGLLRRFWTRHVA